MILTTSPRRSYTAGSMHKGVRQAQTRGKSPRDEQYEAGPMRRRGQAHGTVAMGERWVEDGVALGLRCCTPACTSGLTTGGKTDVGGSISTWARRGREGTGRQTAVWLVRTEILSGELRDWPPPPPGPRGAEGMGLPRHDRRGLRLARRRFASERG